MDDAPARRVVVLGRIAGSFGVHGHLRIRPYTERPDGLLAYAELLLGGAEGWQPVTVERGRVHGGQLIVQIRGVTTREQAVALAGREIAVWRDALPVEAENEVYLVDLVGLEVMHDGRSIGRIDGFVDVGGTSVMRVVAPAAAKAAGPASRSREWLIPLRAPHLVEVDLEEAVVRVEWPEAAAHGS